MAIPSSNAKFPSLDLGLSRLRPCLHGLMIFLSADKIIGHALDLYGEFAEAENLIMVRLTKPGDIVLDIGANIGTVALALAGSVGPSGRVYAFEPQRVIFQHLCANAALNGLTNIDAQRAAVGATAGQARIPALEPAAMANFGEVKLSADITSESVPCEIVPMVTVDDLNLTGCALIKIDVEGMESEVLRGAEQTIAKHRPCLYFEAKKGENTRLCISWLLKKNYSLYWHFAPFFRKANFRGLAANVFGNLGDINALAIPAERQLRANLPPIATADADWESAYRAWLDRENVAFEKEALIASVGN